MSFYPVLLKVWYFDEENITDSIGQEKLTEN